MVHRRMTLSDHPLTTQVMAATMQLVHGLARRNTPWCQSSIAFRRWQEHFGGHIDVEISIVACGGQMPKKIDMP